MAQKVVTQLSSDLAKKIAKIAFIVGAAGLLVSGLFYLQDHHRFFYSYLTAFSFFLTLSLGAMFLVIVQYATRAGWGVVVRRIPEHLMKNVWLMALLFIPLLFGLHDLYHWTHVDAVAHDHLLQIKSPYLNVPFFIVRALLFWGIWLWISKTFFKGSTDQDSSKDKSITLKLQKYSTFSILLFALTITFAGVDWLMSLTPHWFSTMFGVYIFAGAMFGGLALISLLYILLRRMGYLETVVTHEHYHDLGKLFYGFVIFWAYIAFSQYFLIWYANIPEETHWYKEHFAGTWNAVGAFLAAGHFGLPFLVFMSRHVKRHLNAHMVVMIWALFMHYVDLYWLIMPNVDHHGIHVALVDITTLLGIGGLYVGVLFTRLAKYPLYPVSDPRVEESLHFENV